MSGKELEPQRSAMLIKHHDNNDAGAQLLDTYLESRPTTKFSESVGHTSTQSIKT